MELFTYLELVVADQIKVCDGGGVVLKGGVQVGRLGCAVHGVLGRGELCAVVVGLDVAAEVQVSIDLVVEDYFKLVRDWHSGTSFRSHKLLPLFVSSVQGDNSGQRKPPVDLDLGCSAILPGQ